MAHGAQNESQITNNARTGVISRQLGIDLLTHLLQENAPAGQPVETAAIRTIDKWIAQGIADGLLDAGGNPIDPDDRVDPPIAIVDPVGGAGTWDPGYTDEEIAAARVRLGADRSGRFDIFASEQALGPFVNPMLRSVRRASFDPLSAAGALKAAGTPTDRFNFRDFIQEQSAPIPGTSVGGVTPYSANPLLAALNRVGGFGAFSRPAGSPLGALTGSGYLGGIENLFGDFGTTGPSVEQVAARNYLESQAESILPTIAAAGLSPTFQPYARREAGRRMQALDPLDNPFAAFAQGRLSFT